MQQTFRCLAAAVTLLAAPALAQVDVRSRTVELTLSGRVHSQFNASSVEGVPASEFLIRRARFTADVKVNEFVSGQVEPEYGQGKFALKDAYVRLTFGPGLQTRLGQFKRPFDLFELTSSTQILIIERAGDIRGLDTCSGPDGICSYSRFTEQLEYSDRDIGVLLEGVDPSGRLTYLAAVTNGSGENAADENGTKSYSARVRYTPIEDLALAASVAAHDYVHAARGNRYAFALGGDVEIGDFEQGLHVQAGIVAGDNWRNLVDADPSTFVAAQVIVSHRQPRVGHPYLSHIEPLARLSWGDPDRRAKHDAGLLLTPGLVLHFVGRNKIAANLDVWLPSAGEEEWSLKLQSYLHF